MEVHELDRFLRLEEGTGETVMDGVHTKISASFAVLVPALETRCDPGRKLAHRAELKARRKCSF